MQQELFDKEQKPASPKKRDNEYEWSQFVKLGDMMGDGLHYEPDGKWIVREYNRLAKILVPEIREAHAERRKLKAARTNEQMTKLLEEKKCKCGGNLKQNRSGSKKCTCTLCGLQYVANTKKRK